MRVGLGVLDARTSNKELRGRKGCGDAPSRRVKPRSAAHGALGQAIEELRREAGLTQEGLAERVGTEFNRIGELERVLPMRDSAPCCDSPVASMFSSTRSLLASNEYVARQKREVTCYRS